MAPRKCSTRKPKSKSKRKTPKCKTPKRKTRRAVGSRAQVFNGTADHTSGGLKKGDLRKKNGRIISVAASRAARERMQREGKAAMVRVFKPTKGEFTLQPKAGTRRYKALMKKRDELMC